MTRTLSGCVVRRYVTPMSPTLLRQQSRVLPLLDQSLYTPCLRLHQDLTETTQTMTTWLPLLHTVSLEIIGPGRDFSGKFSEGIKRLGFIFRQGRRGYLCLNLAQTQSLESFFKSERDYYLPDDFMRGRIIGKIEEGRKITDVAREFDIAHSVVSRLWKSFKTTGMCSRRHGGGRVRSTMPAEDKYIVLSAKRNRRTTAQQVAN
ncbi:hypothetical protein TNCV_3146791 [Trichonephila clavipes]|nr:hypothetical protein TNCV_3146791 [Trichonephila clavipes]